MKTLTITVPDEMDEEIASWADGESYTLQVVQTAPDTFDLESTGAPEETEPVEPVEKPAEMPASVRAIAVKK